MEISLNTGGIDAGFTENNINLSAWNTLPLDTKSELPHSGNDIQPKHEKQNALMTWYRMEFNLTETDPENSVTCFLRILASGNGYMWLNGHNIGRHYEASPQRDWYLPECWLNLGDNKVNTITIGLRQTYHNAVIAGAEIRPY